MNARTLELSRTPFESTATKLCAGKPLIINGFIFYHLKKNATHNDQNRILDTKTPHHE